MSNVTDNPNFVFTPGMRITNRPGSDGALGCFAQLASSSSTIVLLSNSHVLFNDANQSTEVTIHCPPGGSSCCRNRKIGTTMGTWAGGFHMATIQAGGSASGYETDCAIAQLDPTVKYSNTIPIIGMIAGVNAAANALQLGPSFGQLWTNDMVVRMYSPRLGRVCYGTVAHFGPAGTYTDGGSGALPPLLSTQGFVNTGDILNRDNVPGQPVTGVIILPRPPLPATLPDPSDATAVAQAIATMYLPYSSGAQSLKFGDDGDSGSVIVDKNNMVVGHYFWAAPRPTATTANATEWNFVNGIGAMAPIGATLDTLKAAGTEITIPANLGNATPSAGAAVAIADDGIAQGIDRVIGLFGESEGGRVLLAAIQHHAAEARRIVLGTRHGVVAWHRHRGPSFAHHIARSLRANEHVIPDRIDGVSREQLINVLAELLLRYGGDEIKRDVSRYRTLATHVVAKLRTVDDLARFAAVQP